MITASVCTIGDEILIGQIVDTNSSKIATALNAIGVKVNSMVSIGDNEPDMIASITRCMQEHHVVILTGGLGPTKDDITKKTLAKLTGASGYVENRQQLAIIQNILTTRGVEISDINRAQALVPDTCTVLLNECGTAPNMEFVIPEERFGHKVVVYSLPGVPFEAEAAIPKVTDAIRGHFQLEKIFHKTICTFGIPESALAKKIEHWEDHLPDNLHLAYLPNPILGVRLRLSIYGVDPRQGETELTNCSGELKELLQEALYGEGGDSLQAVIGRALKQDNATISVAESCTGGLLASLLTSVPGSSAYFYGGIVSYHNSIKINTLGVDTKTIETYGAVSSQCVAEMALGVKRLMQTDYAIATSGIAGPDGGTPDKPVGIVWVAIAGENGVQTARFNFKGSRQLNTERFASHALNFFRLGLLHKTI